MLALVAVVTGGAPWLLALLALELVIALVFGRRYCRPCVAYFELIQPRFADARSRTRSRRGPRTLSVRPSSLVRRPPTPCTGW